MYCSRADIENVYGAANLRAWADLDSDRDVNKIAARIDAAIAWATAEVDDRLRGGPYALPLTIRTSEQALSSSMSSGDLRNVPSAINYCCAVMAGCWLYEARGVMDQDPQTGEGQHRLRHHQRWAVNRLRAIMAGSVKLDAIEVDGCGWVPTVVHGSSSGTS